MFHKIFLFTICTCFVVTLCAQQNLTNEGNVLLFNINYNFQTPQGDLQDRFGTSSAIGLGFDYLTAKQNFILGVESSFIFGSQVKQDVLATIRTNAGYIIATDREVADIQLRERGLFLGGHIGKLFSVVKNNPRSGIRATIGLGLLQHKIRIQDDPQRTVSQLVSDYKKGYDRLSNGLAITQFIGYQHLGKNRQFNFYAGVEFTEGFTQNRRAWNFDTRSADTAERFDMLISLKLNWILPFYFTNDTSEIIY